MRSIFSSAAVCLISAACSIASLSAEAWAQDLLLWNGEEGDVSTMSFYYGAADSSQAVAGSWSFAGAPDPWHEPGIGLNNLPSWRADLSTCDELWFYARADQEGKTFAVKVYGWPSFSRQVAIDPYIEGGKLDTRWRLVRIPIDSLKTAEFPLDKVEILYFGTAQPSSGHQIYIDEVRAMDFVPAAPAPAPVISVMPISLDFGAQKVGTAATQTLTVANTGDAVLKVADIAVSGSEAAEFSAAPAAFSVAPGASQAVSVTFAPQAAGSRSATLSLTHNDPDHSPTQVGAGGAGLAPDIALADSALAFGEVMVGQSVSRTLTVANTGTAELVVNHIASSNAAFAASPTAFAVPAGSSTDVTVIFSPAVVGSASSTLTIVSDDPDESAATVDLSGAGTEAVESLLLWNGEGGSVSSTIFHYGSAVSSGTYAGSWSFEGTPDPWHEPGIGLNNLSSWRADISVYDEIRFYARADMAGRTFDFSLYGWPERSRRVNIDAYIDGGALTTEYREVRIPVDSLKTSAFALNKVEILYFGVAQPSSGHKIYIDEVRAVRGASGGSPPVAAAPDIAVSPASLAFGGVSIGQSSSLTLNVANSGSADLAVSSISSSDPAFAASPASFTVPAGGNLEVAVAFSPTVVGSWSDTLSIASNDPDQNPLAIALSGSATDTATAPGTPGEVSVTGVTSSSVALQWGAVSGATEVRVYLAAEPAAVAGAPLPGQVQVATLPGHATAHQLTGLAPAVDLFLRVEIRTPSGTGAANLHARTQGGPRATLDTPLREVHAYAPHILQLTLANPGAYYNGTTLTGNTGPTWQAGPWTVTRPDGAPIPVIQVYRHSIPVGQPAYQLGYGQPYDDNVVDVDHRLYLMLAEAIGSRELLQVSGPLGLSVTLPFSDRYLETPVLQLNQVGYHPLAHRRWAYVSGWMGDGGPLPLAAFSQVAEVLAEASDPALPRPVVVSGLPLSGRAALDGDAGTEVRQIDLAGVPAAEGTIYRVRLPGVGVSWPTTVSQAAARSAYRTIVRGLFHNRWGGELRAPYTAWTRPADHSTVYTAEGTDPRQFYPQSTPQVDPRPLVGGYHDAGDFDQRPMHVTVAQLLLRAFELHPAAFADGDLNLPESGNQIPDLLDEALWGIAAWEQLQEGDGGVRQGVESWRHPWGYYPADADPLPYWTYAREANHTARVAGLFAQAARLLAPYDAARADRLRTRAIDAFGYAVAHGARPAQLLYAAGELYRLTGEAVYPLAFESAWSALGLYGAFSSFATTQFYMGDYFSNSRAMPDFLLGYLGASGADGGILSTSDTWLGNYADQAVSAVLNSSHAHRSPRPAGQSLNWGNGVTLGKYLDTLYGRLQLGGLSPTQLQDAFDALSLTTDYVLGGNPDGRVYFTGLGARPVQEPLHLDALSFLQEGQEAIPGIPVYGPVDGLPAAAYYDPGEAGFYPPLTQHPPLRRYADLRTFVATNEFSVWESQAPHAELFAALQGVGAWLAAGGAAKEAGSAPGEKGGGREGPAMELKSNHPNPFNPSTTLSYVLFARSGVRLVVYNVLGQPVRVLVEAVQGAGAHSVVWDGRDAAGRKVAAGLYFYRLEAGSHAIVHRMVLLK